MRILLFLTTALIFSSCQTTHQTNQAEPSGFLKSYEHLEKGEDEQIQARYLDEEADWTKYKKIIVDPIQVWRQDGDNIDEAQLKELKDISNYLHAIVRTGLQEDFQLVSQQGEDVLRLRIAMTDTAPSKPVRDLISNIIPVGLAFSAIKRITSGTHLSVGKATVEFELLDSLSGKQLAAGLDQRAGGKVLRGKFDRWADIKDAFEYWSEALNETLAKKTQTPLTTKSQVQK